MKQSGMVLIVVMLFLTIISVLVISILTSSILETKLSGYYKNKIQSFYQAESLLAQYERNIIADKMPAAARIIDATSICGAIFYLVTAQANYLGAKTKLQSTLIKLDPTINCQSKTNINSGRQSLLEII